MAARPKANEGPIIVTVDDELDLLIALSDHFRAAVPNARVFPAESGPSALEFIQGLNWQTSSSCRAGRRPPS